MKIAVSFDHRGAPVSPRLIAFVQSLGHERVEVPVCDGGSCDYPDMAYHVARAVADGRADRGVLICSSGIGMSIAANKVHGVRAALIHDAQGAEMSRRHNDANVICLSADGQKPEQLEEILAVWLRTDFEGGRHARRVRKIGAIEAGGDPASVKD
ncbi:MAG: RpiB/LacA/LacB family sugar-phosphate isomerase [Phycisphaeraceae bacterium]|nr:RpiB/LacA/LacB family sugar-phosphate isomerase [Phycisphaeraceae bacterium]